MSASELLNQLSERGIEVWVEGEKLRFRARKDALTQDMRDAMVSHKEEIIQILRERASQIVTYHPLSYAQQSMWFLNQSAPDSAAYHVAFTARITSEINLNALRQSLQALIDRHPMLRTVYSLQNGAPVQEIRGQVEVPFEVVDASMWSSEELAARIKATYNQPFLLDVGPVMRTYLFTRQPQDHVLLMVAHHIAVDGWSLRLLLEELSQLYAAYVSGGSASLPRLETHYNDYVKWQDELLKSADGERMDAFWKVRLAGEQPILNLPTDRSRPMLQNYRGDTYHFNIGPTLTHQLKELAKAQKVTLYTLLLTAFEVLLYRYTGQEEFLIGAPTFGRSKADFASIVGHFVNMVAVQANFTDQPPFTEMVSRVHKTMLETLENQDYPFPLLVRKYAGNIDPSRSPLFQIVFDVQRIQESGLSKLFVAGEDKSAVNVGGMQMEAFPMQQQEGQFDIVLQIAEASDFLPSGVKYNTDLFNRATIERMTQHFERLLEGIVAKPEMKVSELPILSDAERHRLLVEWNQVSVPFPDQICVHEVVEAQAAQTPDAIAIVHGDDRLTYSQLNQRANQLAHYLRKQGVGPGMHVALCGQSSAEIMVGKLGILKAGAAYVPLDPDYPVDRIEFILNDLQSAVLLTQSAFVEKLTVAGGHMICLDSDWPDISQESAEPLENLATPDNLAYLIYTSGSTGKPKGVPIRHRSLMNLVSWHQRAFQVTADDHATQIANLAFDASVWETWPYLTKGATLHILNKIGFMSSDQLQSWLLENQITISFVPTPVAEALLNLTWPEKVPLRYLLVGGDKLYHYPPASLPFALVNNYGPSESTVVTTSGIVPVEKGPTPAPTLGKAIDNTPIYILDANLQLVPVGAAGELHISGAGLTPGYHNRPELTAEKFIPNIFSDSYPQMYKTGDLVRYLPDGEIEFLGRIDHQVKLRGFRIELGEIEAILAQHPAIEEALVVLREEKAGDKRLVGYVVPHKTSKVASQDLSVYLKEHLPAYMVPSAFVILEAMPLSPNGKIDRRALPAPDYVRLERSVVPPETEMEKLLAETWQEVLGSGPVSIYDNFFDLGGHSLMAMQTINKLNDKTGLKLDPALMRFQTLKQIAAAYAEQQAQPSAPETPEAGKQSGLTRRFLNSIRGSSQDS